VLKSATTTAAIPTTGERQPLWLLLLLVTNHTACCWGRHATVQYSTVQYSTVQFSSVQYSTVQYSTVQYSTWLRRTQTQLATRELELSGTSSCCTPVCQVGPRGETHTWRGKQLTNCKLCALNGQQYMQAAQRGSTLRTAHQHGAAYLLCYWSSSSS
jgi:hypothetical protein